MRTPVFLIYRGSSPTLELRMPKPMDPTDTVFLTLAQAGLRVVEYAWNGTPVQPGDGSLSPAPGRDDLLLLRMTQGDTLRLAAGDCELQLRMRDENGIRVLPLLHGAVGEVRKQEVIS